MVSNIPGIRRTNVENVRDATLGWTIRGSSGEAREKTFPGYALHSGIAGNSRHGRIRGGGIEPGKKYKGDPVWTKKAQKITSPSAP